MRADSISRRLDAIEAKLLPKMPIHIQSLAQNAAFVRILDRVGVTVEAFQRNGLAALPRDLLRAIVERLKVIATPQG